MSKTFELPEFERKETRKRVEEALHMARLWIQVGYHPGGEVSVTQGYSDMPSSVTNVVKSSTESVSIRNVDVEQQRKAHVHKILWAVNKLSKVEREIITKCYLEDDDARDYIIQGEMHIHYRKFVRLKANAIYKLALILKLEVYKEEEAK